MKPITRRLVLTGAGIGAAALGASFAWRRLNPPAASPVAQAFWARRFTGLDGTELDVARWRGQPLLVNFWATWCPPCVEEMPSMVQLQKKMANDPRFVLLAVSADESWDPVRTFFGKDTPAFTVLLDPKGELAKKYGTTMFPETYVVKGGRIIGFIEGPRRWDEWYAEKYLRELLESG